MDFYSYSNYVAFIYIKKFGIGSVLRPESGSATLGFVTPHVGVSKLSKVTNLDFFIF
jgi:hypothetical protein